MVASWTYMPAFFPSQQISITASGQCALGTGGPFAEAKVRPGRDADHAPI
jgi:hypothetical protein